MSHFTGDKDIGIAAFPIKSCILEASSHRTHTHTNKLSAGVGTVGFVCEHQAKP